MSSQHSDPNSPKLFLSILVIAVVVSQGSSLNAQLTRGFISGIVTDPSNAVISGARVTITNTARNLQRETSTNEVGVYRFVAVEPGAYAIEFAAAGFETRKLEVIEVGTAEEVVLNQTLAVSPQAATVEVLGTLLGVEVRKATPTIERTLEGRFVSEVPLTGALRNINVLALLAPTVNRAPGSTEFSANGQRARNNNFLIDGTDNNDLSVTVQNARVLPEAVAEFQVQTTSYSAEYGRSSGAQISVITRSGTNASMEKCGTTIAPTGWSRSVCLINEPD